MPEVFFAWSLPPEPSLPWLPWFDPDALHERAVAYFSMGIALEAQIPTYGGDLGMLAGDTIRSACRQSSPDGGNLTRANVIASASSERGKSIPGKLDTRLGQFLFSRMLKNDFRASSRETHPANIQDFRSCASP
jgi:hypothetical protein